MTTSNLVEGHGARVKIEVNFVFRGAVLPVVQNVLIQTAQDLFTTEVVLPVLDTAELCGSKLVAAMDRQHPRDIFDVMKMLERFGWQSSFVDCFVAYLAGHNRPMHELLFPKSCRSRIFRSCPPNPPRFTAQHEELAKKLNALRSAR